MRARAFIGRRRRLLTIAISAGVGVIAALSGLYSISVLPPGLHARHVTIGVATTHVLLDSGRGLVGDAKATDVTFGSYTTEAGLYASVMTSQPAQREIAARLGINPDQLTARARMTGALTVAFTNTRTEQRANQLTVASRPYRIEVQPDPNTPVIAVYAQAPTAAGASALANTSVAVLKKYSAANPQFGLGTRQPIVLEQLGLAGGEVVNGKTDVLILLLTFLVGSGVAAAVLVGANQARRGFIEAGRRKDAGADAAPSPARAILSSRPATALRRHVGPGGDWPRTTRVLPWMVAAFLVIVWLLPFNDIQLSSSLPFDLKLDRIVLPVLALIWLLSIAVGGDAAPRPRITRIHVGFLTFAAVVGIGIVLNAASLNQALEFTLSTKKLTLLLSYGLMFAIIASSIRPSEVRAFFKFSLVMAVLCAIGSIYEYRFHYNVFYDLSSKIFGKVFSVTPFNPNELDELGRRMTRGPTDHPLELTGMLTMALPIALIGIMRSERRRDRILYALAACLLLAAAVATDRKSALLAPLAVVATIAFYYRSRLMRLAPLVLILLVAIHVLSPGALGSVVDQLNPSNFGVSTVSDRVADYDAVRADVWSHLAFGRGYGSYDHVNYRVLDSDVLSRLVDTGILGVLAFFFLLACVIFAARRIINQRGLARAPDALAVAAAACAYGVLMFLFDVSSFPHVPYTFLAFAGLLAVHETREKDAVAAQRTADPFLVPRLPDTALANAL